VIAKAETQADANPAVVSQGLLYGVNAAGELIASDPAAGFVERSIGPIGVPTVNALAYDNRLDTLYGLTADGKLLEIDRRTGRGKLVQRIAGTSRSLFSSLAFEPAESGGRLYAANALEGRGFFRIDLRNSPPYSVIRLGSTLDRGASAQVTGLAVQPGTGRFYAIQRNHNALGFLAPDTGAFTKVFPNCGINNPEGLAFDPLAGALYGVFSPATLGIYDLATGMAKPLGRTTSLTALAYAPPPLAPLAPTNISRFPLPDENLRVYKKRMDAYFAPQIASRGLRALAEDEAGEYGEYIRFMRTWEPRLYPHGDFKIYFQLEKNYYGHGRDLGISAKPSAARTEKESAALGAGSLAAGNANVWQEVGPAAKPAGSLSATGIGPIEFITFYNPSPSHMLCGSTSGGLFFSTNSGANWYSAGTDTQIGRSGVSTAVFHPGDFKTWFAASAGNSGHNDPTYVGFTGGIFRTTDEGATWVQIGTQTDLGGIWSRIFKLAINPANANQLWAATSYGLYVTTNALAASPTWSAVPALAGKYLNDLEIRPGDANWLYATAADWSANSLVNWRFMYSSDNGGTWQIVPDQPRTVGAASGLTIEVTPAKADNLYGLVVIPDLVIVGQSSISRSELYIYDFGGKTWKAVLGAANITMGDGHAFGVDPVNPNEIFLSNDTEGRRYTYLSHLVKPPIPPYVDFHSTYFTGGTYHPDIEDLVPHPVNVKEVWMSHHGGVSVSTDNGQTWTDRSTGLGVAQVFRMATGASDPSYVSLGLFHDGTVLTTSPWHDLWSPGWKTVTPGDGLRPLIDAATPQYMWSSNQGGLWYRSTNTGIAFGSNGPSSPVWNVDAALNHLNPSIQYRHTTDASGTHTVMRTFDHGNTWDEIASFSGYTLLNVYTPETNGDYLVAHLEKSDGTHHLFRTKIANDPSAATVISSWRELPLPIDLWMSDLDFDPVNPDIVYIANSSSNRNSSSLTGAGMVFKVDYTNPAAQVYGVCTPGICKDLTQNLPNATAGSDSLGVDKGGNGSLYFASDFGVWYSSNVTRATGGSGWKLLGSGLPNTADNGLEINYVNKKVRVASFGRGVWEADLAAGCIQPPSQPALWLPLDETAGSTALNAVLPNRPGTHFGGPTPMTVGKVAGALCFDGQDDHVDVPAYSSISFSASDFSLDAWVLRKIGASDLDVLIDRRTDAAGPVVGYSLFLNGGQIGLQIADGTYDNYLTQSKIPDDGLWHHVAVTVERGNSAGGRFYLDGQPAAPAFDPTTHRGSLNTSAPFRVGARSALISEGAVSGVLHGCLDEVGAFRRALSPAEVLSIYEAGADGMCKQDCSVPQLTFCAGASVASVAAQICNHRSASQTYDYAFHGLPVQSGCAFPGPMSITPASGTMTVPPGTCQSLRTSIDRPTGMTDYGNNACYQLLVQVPATQETFRCGATVDARTQCDIVSSTPPEKVP
jgi:photosystem II stability/assembly factor-like uncharacterized protein